MNHQLVKLFWLITPDKDKEVGENWDKFDLEKAGDLALKLQDLIIPFLPKKPIITPEEKRDEEITNFVNGMDFLFGENAGKDFFNNVALLGSKTTNSTKRDFLVKYLKQL